MIRHRSGPIIGVLLISLIAGVVPFFVAEPAEAVGSVVLLERGSVVYNGGGSYTYSTVLGEYNTYDSGLYRYYVYDDGGHSVDFAGHTLTLYDWYATFENESQVLVDDMRWVVEYWAGNKWRVLDLWEHSWLPVTEGNYLTFGQHYTDGFSTLDVWYQVRNYDQMKITLNFTAFEARTYRFVWKFTGVDGNPTTLPNAVEFNDVHIGWGDADLNATYEWTVADKKCDITFDNVTIGAGQTYTLDPSVHPVMGADSDDDWWDLDEEGEPEWTHNTADTLLYMSEYHADYWYVCQMRFSLAIAQSATINSANLTAYEEWDLAAGVLEIYRIDEANVGDLEADATIPVHDDSESHSWTFDAGDDEWNTENVTDLVQTQVNLGGWVSGQYIGFHFNDSDAGVTLHRFEGYSNAGTNHAYMNVSYTVGAGNNAPSNDGCTLTNPDDTDNLYAKYKEYIFTSNVSDADGFADVDYIELSCYSGSAYWTVRYDEDTDTFSEEAGGSYITLGGSSNAAESGNDIDVEWYIEIEWAHGDLSNYDLRQYVVDDEPESDTDDYDVNYDYETRVDITTGPTLSDGSGTLDRGDYNSVDGITASGTIDYYGSAISPDSGDVDVWISCGDVAGSPWSDLTLSAGAFSTTVDSDDVVGLDTYTFKVVAEGGGAGGADLCQASETDTYIADRMVIVIAADDTSVTNGTQVNFTLTVTYDYDDTAFTGYTIGFDNDAVHWATFTNANKSLFNDTDADTTNDYTANSFTGEAVHVITEYTCNTESVTWSAAATTTVEGSVYKLFQWEYGDRVMLAMLCVLIVICGIVIWDKMRW